MPTIVQLVHVTLGPPRMPATAPWPVAVLPLIVLLAMVTSVPTGALTAPLKAVLLLIVEPVMVTTVPPPRL